MLEELNLPAALVLCAVHVKDSAVYCWLTLVLDVRAVNITQTLHC